MVVCIECKSTKQSGEFYSHPQMASGHVNVCKDCHKERMRIRRRTNPKVQEYDRERYKTPARKEAARIRAKADRQTNPIAYKARTAVGNAVRDGRLKKLPCEFCGTEKVEAHHQDYSKPLSVTWLCRKCHHRLHALLPEKAS